jgi:hypothetical protein
MLYQHSVAEHSLEKLFHQLLSQLFLNHARIRSGP